MCFVCVLFVFCVCCFQREYLIIKISIIIITIIMIITVMAEAFSPLLSSLSPQLPWTISPDGTVGISSANGLVGTGFASCYWLEPSG